MKKIFTKRNIIIAVVVIAIVAVCGIVAYNTANMRKSADDSLAQLKVRSIGAKAVIDELILSDEQEAKLKSDAEEIRAYAENTSDKSANTDMLQKMRTLEKEVDEEKENSLKLLDEKETEVATLVATTNAPAFKEGADVVESHGEDVIVLDEATSTSLEEMKKDFFSLKKEEKYKSAYKKANDVIALLQGKSEDKNSADNEKETGNTTTNNSDKNSGSTGNANSNNTANNTSSGSSANKPQAPVPSTPSNDKAGVAETFYNGSVGNGVTAEQKAYIDGLVNTWLNGGYSNAELEDLIANYLMDNGYNLTRVSAVRESRILIPSGVSYTLNGVMTGKELYYYGKRYTTGEMNGNDRVGYYSNVSIF